jgi:acyl carrier protein
MEGERLMAASATAIQDVREVLAAYPELADLAVLTRVQEPVGEVRVAYVVPGTAGFDLAALHRHVRGLLPGAAVPAAIVVVEAIPLDSTGNPQEQVLPAPDLRGLLPYRPPGTARQEALCTIFAEVLARPRCGLDDDFFTMGGESIDAMLIASRIGPALGLEISMNELFDAPTVAELDQLLDRLNVEG